MSYDDLASPELAMIREILQRNLPLAMLGIRDARFESLSNSCEPPASQPEPDDTSRKLSHLSRTVAEGTRSPIEYDRPVADSAGDGNRHDGR
jgi:hypothetical protein